MNKSDFVLSYSDLKKYLTGKAIDINKAKLTFPMLNTNFPIFVSYYYLDLIDWYDPCDPLRRMVIPDERENDTYDYEQTDPIGDKSHSPVAGIVHRYPDRVLLMLNNNCPVRCRFCFRRNMLYSNTYDFEKSLAYIAKHREIWEVILSGGDPFMLTLLFMAKIVTRLRKINHVKMIRFHTRAPAVYPQAVSDELVNILKSAAPCTVVLHVNHPREITQEFVESVSRLKSAGALLLSQTVLMKGVNDRVEVLAGLFRRLVEVGVKPYYLHHLDLALGTHHFRVSVAKGKKLILGLRGNISGLCIPEYVIDTPGGQGKIPVFWFSNNSEHIYTGINFEGKQIKYTDYAQEK